MRHTRFLMITSGLFAVALAGWASGCGTTYDDCVSGKIGACKGIYTESTGTGGSGGSSTTTTTTGTGGMGGEGGMAPSCIGDPTQDPSLLSKTECLAFVRADAADDQGDGSKDKPYKTLQSAVDKADKRWIIACTKGSFAEAVTLAGPVEIYGGFDCDAEWTWSETARTKLDGPSDSIALTITSAAGGTKIKNLAITAASATVPGGSSIAVAVSDIDAELTRCDIVAGDGMKGEDGAPPMPATAKNGDSAMAGSASNACVVEGAVLGGEPGSTTCDDGTSAGGLGGTGGLVAVDSGNGQSGANGTPVPDPNPNGDGVGGTGQGAAACKNGANGQAGTPGNAGMPESTIGTLSLSGIIGGDGNPGLPGKSGQGGGGGGGAKAGKLCGSAQNPVDGPGASGGGGGAGGCGGKGGLGGKAGGSSIGIISLGITLTLTEVTVKTGTGAFGGNGKEGQNGGDPGLGVTGGAKAPLPGSANGCKGGDGGTGGFGGPGAGGRGGHSIGLAYAKTPAATPDVVFMNGTAGKGGAAGFGAPPSSDGIPGIGDAKAQCWDFAKDSGCP
jgi:hypothetical protein